MAKAKSLNIPLHAAEIAALCSGKYDGADFSALDFSTDTRTLIEGTLFIALHGPNFKGEDFLAQAKEKGAVAALVQKKTKIDLPQIVVKDTHAALLALARDRRARSRAQFFAITGTNGKTSTKEMLQRLLQSQGQTLATIGNLNNDIGVPLTLLRLRDEDRFAVIEMGANHRGEIAALTDLVRPDVALITNVSAAHLAGFGSLEGVIAAKSEIYSHSNGAIVINRDIAPAHLWQETFRNRAQKTFSLDSEADVSAQQIAADGSAFTLHYAGADYPIHWKLVGRHNVANALAACAAATFADVSGGQMQQTLGGLALYQSRLTAHHVGVHTVYDDTYNANPASFKAAIDVIAMAPRSVVIAGAMGELGEAADDLHHEVAAYAAEKDIDGFWVVGDGSAQSYLSAFPSARHFADVTTAGAALSQLLQDSTPTTVLVKGSRSAGMEGVLAAAGLKTMLKG
ncbi:MAG: UDP-N-acetylmuramoyl-tripeptide--D-alanyl-D-alanine ligase [Cardiobacteriaceae bacterium]|nr:UDP-N-acetylmuramoyl-tripeptide--D-alanyl-D-alanine ligase [Cardiobacteriaceae bacterium]